MLEPYIFAWIKKYLDQKKDDQQTDIVISKALPLVSRNTCETLKIKGYKTKKMQKKQLSFERKENLYVCSW